MKSFQHNILNYNMLIRTAEIKELYNFKISLAAMTIYTYRRVTDEIAVCLIKNV